MYVLENLIKLPKLRLLYLSSSLRAPSQIFEWSDLERNSKYYSLIDDKNKILKFKTDDKSKKVIYINSENLKTVEFLLSTIFFQSL